jgi:hypothetical protein
VESNAHRNRTRAGATPRSRELKMKTGARLVVLRGPLTLGGEGTEARAIKTATAERRGILRNRIL